MTFPGDQPALECLTLRFRFKGAAIRRQLKHTVSLRYEVLTRGNMPISWLCPRVDCNEKLKGTNLKVLRSRCVPWKGFDDRRF